MSEANTLEVKDNMDANYFAEKKTEHRYSRKEGYMVVVDVPFARTGFQSYHHSELRINDSAITSRLKQGMNDIYRPEKEVFDELTMASFENVPITINHPPEMVNSTNWSRYAIGNVVNVRRGTGKYSNYLIGDFWIMDDRGVNVVDNKIQEEVSAGYNCDWAVVDNHVAQVNIRGNHVAIVRKGRAGHDARIGDEEFEENVINYHSTIVPDEELKVESEVININDNEVNEKYIGGCKDMKENLSLTQKLLRAIGLNDDQVDIADALINDKEDLVIKKPMEEDVIDKKSKDDEDEDDKMEDARFKAIEDSIDELKSLVAQMVKDGKEVVETGVTNDESMVAKAGEASLERGKSLEELYEGLQADSADIPTELSPDGKLILNNIFKPIANMKDSVERKAVCDEILAILKDTMVPSTNTVDKVVEIVAENNSKPTMGTSTVDSAKLQNLYDNANPHLNKEVK